jgi:hypothetical protein
MDVVRLAIVYDTSQAASNLNLLNTRLGVSQSTMKKAGLGALQLAQAMESGSISAVGMAGSLGRVASVLFGPWGLALAFAAAAVTFFLNKQAKAKEQSEKFADELRNTKRSIDNLLNPGTQSPFASEIDRLTDKITELDRRIKAAASSWGNWIQNAFAAATAFLPGGMPKVGFAGPPTGLQGQKSALEGQKGRLGGVDAQLTRYNSLMEQQGRLLEALGGGQIPALESAIDLLRDHMDALSHMTGEDAAAALAAASGQMSILVKRLNEVERSSRLLERGLFTIADAIEDFVVTGTLAFTDFLNNILRLLYQDFSSELIGSILRSVTASPTKAGADAGDVIPMGQPSGSVQTNVNFSIQAIDAQGVASFLQANGPAIAATVGNQAARAAGLRRQFRR